MGGGSVKWDPIKDASNPIDTAQKKVIGDVKWDPTDDIHQGIVDPLAIKKKIDQTLTGGIGTQAVKDVLGEKDRSDTTGSATAAEDIEQKRSRTTLLGGTSRGAMQLLSRSGK